MAKRRQTFERAARKRKAARHAKAARRQLREQAADPQSNESEAEKGGTGASKREE